MRKLIGRLCVTGMAAIVVQLGCSSAWAVDTVADWTGSGNTAVPGNANNYTVLSPTSVGGTFQDVVPIGSGGANFADFQLSDTLDATLTFANELHMTGTVTFSNPSGVLPNLCLCWFDKDDTRHRIGLGFANSTTAPYVNLPNYMRVDVGFATTTVTNPNPPPATFGNYFSFVSADGTNQESNYNSILPNGTYPFTFDYVPGIDQSAGGMMSATVGSFFHLTQPLGQLNIPQGDYNNNNNVDAGDYVAWRKGGTLANEVDTPGTVDAADYTEWRKRYGALTQGTGSKPWFFDGFEFDSFGFVQRTRTNPPGTGGSYSLTISNITYTGGTPAAGSASALGAVPEPTTAWLAMLATLTTVASWRRRP